MARGSPRGRTGRQPAIERLRKVRSQGCSAFPRGSTIPAGQPRQARTALPLLRRLCAPFAGGGSPEFFGGKGGTRLASILWVELTRLICYPRRTDSTLTQERLDKMYGRKPTNALFC